MRILLTGATGFVGRQVHKALVARGTEVRVVLRTGTGARLAASAERIIETPDLFAEKAAWWSQACAGVDAVVIAALSPIRRLCCGPRPAPLAAGQLLRD